MAYRYPQPPSTAQPRTAVIGANIPNMFPGTTAWSQQPARPQIEQNEKHKEYLKQQQKLRLMAATSTSQTVSADALIENLLGKKETFKPKATQTSSGTATVPAPVPVIGGVGFGSMAPLHMSYTSPPPPVSTVPPQTLMGGFASPAVPPGAAEPINQQYNTPFLSTVNPNISAINSQTKVTIPSQFGTPVPAVSVNLPPWLSPSSQALPQFYRQVWKLVGQEKGLVDTKRIFPILLTSGLPTDVLGFIWGMANRNATGQLTEQELYIVLALVALAQSGCTFNNLSILNLIPQAPIPNLNLTNIEPAMPHVGGETSSMPHVGGETSAVPTQAKMRREELNLNPTTSFRDYSSAPSFLEDDGFDDFTDFQSAVPASDETTSHPLPASSVNVPNRDTASPSFEQHSVLPEVMVETPFVQKFPSVVVVTNSTGRSIGSRLANHSLGTPKQSKVRHHKHHHHHHHHHHRSQTQMTNQVPSSVDDDFTDFQQATNTVPSMNEAFPKCVMKQPVAKTYLLKESAIRSEVEPANKESLAPKSIDVHFSGNNEKQKSFSTRRTENEEQEKSKDLTFTTAGSSSKETKTDGTKDLMLIEEDKYSALRNLTLTAPDTTSTATDHSPASDEFGDFLSAEPVQSVEDSFADIATRSNNVLGAAVEDVWKTSTVNEPQPAEFAVDDWGDFEGAPQITEAASGVNSSATDLSLSLMGLDLNAGHSKQGETVSEITDSTLRKNVTDGKAASADLRFDDSWDLKIQDSKESTEDFSSVSTSNTEGFIGFLGNIYSTGDKLEQNDTKPDIFDSDSDYLHRNTLDSDNQQCINNDDFGEFVGPETWAEQKYEATGKDIAVENQLAIGLYADTQSVSSLELPPLTLSRHGSVPSLDLKIFPTSTERSGGNGGNQPWDLSPQGIDHQLSEWQRCLRSCLTLLQATANIFGNVSKEEVVEEVVGCSEGKSYLQNLLEVYGVCRRVEWSYKQMGSGAENKEIDSLLADIYSAWTFLESLYVKADILIGLNFGVPADGNNREAATSCGVCLTDVTAGKTEKSIMNTSQLEYGGHVYHSACANLWVNCVDSSLPALATGGSAFL